MNQSVKTRTVYCRITLCFNFCFFSPPPPPVAGINVPHHRPLSLSLSLFLSFSLSLSLSLSLPLSLSFFISLSLSLSLSLFRSLSLSLFSLSLFLSLSLSLSLSVLFGICQMNTSSVPPTLPLKIYTVLEWFFKQLSKINRTLYDISTTTAKNSRNEQWVSLRQTLSSGLNPLKWLPFTVLHRWNGLHLLCCTDEVAYIYCVAQMKWLTFTVLHRWNGLYSPCYTLWNGLHLLCYSDCEKVVTGVFILVCVCACVE